MCRQERQQQLTDKRIKEREEKIRQERQAKQRREAAVARRNQAVKERFAELDAMSASQRRDRANRLRASRDFSDDTDEAPPANVVAQPQPGPRQQPQPGPRQQPSQVLVVRSSQAPANSPHRGLASSQL